MSLNKKLKTEPKVEDMSTVCDQTIRQSFDRFEDKLIEELVYYLTLKDKIVLIGVNKRLKACLSKSRMDLVVDRKIGNRFNSVSELEQNDSQSEEAIAEEESDEGSLDYFLKVNKPALNWLLQTFTCIETLDLRNCLLDSQTIDLICANNCLKLQFFKFTDYGIDEKSITKLGQTYGTRLTKLKIQSSFSGSKSGFDKLFLSFCDNLTHIYCESIDSFTDNSVLFLPKLQNVFTLLSKTEDFESLKKVVYKYKEQMNSLSLFVHLDNGIDFNKNLDLVSNLSNLKTINLDFFDSNNSQPIDESFQKIAIKCSQIETIRISFNFCCNRWISTQLLHSFGRFHNMRRFYAQLLVTEEDDNNGSNSKNIEELRNSSISCLKDCRLLTHLDLCFSEMTDKFVENIELYSPNLTSIHLSSAQQLSNSTLNSLNKLKSLKYLKFSKNRFKRETFPEITDLGICALMALCPSMRTLIFLGRPNITQQSVDCFIRLAKKYPQRGYRFECLFKDTDISDEQLLDTIDVKGLEIPKNLWIKIERIDESIEDEDDYIDSDEDSDDLMEDSDDYDSDNEIFDLQKLED